MDIIRETIETFVNGNIIDAFEAIEANKREFEDLFRSYQYYDNNKEDLNIEAIENYYVNSKMVVEMIASYASHKLYN